MLIGILSDTHDRAEMAAKGIAMLRDAGAEFFIHCGDLCSEPVLDHLAGLPGAFVFGNCDWDRNTLRKYAAITGVRCCETFGEFEFDGRRLAVSHGDDPSIRKRVLKDQKHDYFLQGHSHVRENQKIGAVRVINPGALHRASEKTVAVLDTEKDAVRFLVVG